MMLKLLVVVFTCVGCGLCLSSQQQVIDHVINEANNYIRESFKNVTVLRDSFNYKFNEYFTYSSNYSLRDFASATRAKDVPISVMGVKCGPYTTRFLLNMELFMKEFELEYNAHWKLFLFNYNGNMTISNNDLRGRLTGEIVVDTSKRLEHEVACIPKWKSLVVSRWGDFKLNFSNDNILYRPLEKILSFVLTVHVPKVVTQIISRYGTNFPVPETLTKRICPYFWEMAKRQW